MNVDNELKDFDAAGALAEETALVGLARRWPILSDAGRGAYGDCELNA